MASSQNVPLFSLQNAGTGIVFVRGYMNVVTSNFWKYFIVGAKGYIRCVCFKTVLHYSGWPCVPPDAGSWRCPPVHQDTKNIQRVSLGKRPGHGSFQGNSYCCYFCKGINTTECENIVILKCQGMKGVRAVFIIDAVY